MSKHSSDGCTTWAIQCKGRWEKSYFKSYTSPGYFRNKNNILYLDEDLYSNEEDEDDEEYVPKSKRSKKINLLKKENGKTKTLRDIKGICIFRSYLDTGSHF